MQTRPRPAAVGPTALLLLALLGTPLGVARLSAEPPVRAPLADAGLPVYGPVAPTGVRLSGPTASAARPASAPVAAVAGTTGSSDLASAVGATLPAPMTGAAPVGTTPDAAGGSALQGGSAPLAGTLDTSLPTVTLPRWLRRTLPVGPVAGGATATADPTTGPTADPTADPTASPTVGPTAAPTASPTVGPTAAPAPSPAAPTAAPASVTPPVAISSLTGAAPVGDLPGWKQTFLDDFTTPAPLGTFPTSPAYANRWAAYGDGPDTSGVGRYAASRVLSVSNGALDMYMHTENGTPLGAAVLPLYDGKWSGQAYGRFSVRFRADSMRAYGAAFLLWPNSDVWNDGEIDFPEGNFDETIAVHDHCVGDAARSCWDKDTGTTWTDWHTSTIEWRPGAVSFFLDGKLLGTSTSSPTARMHLVLQTGTSGQLPAATTAGHVQIDWVSIWSPTP